MRWPGLVAPDRRKQALISWQGVVSLTFGECLLRNNQDILGINHRGETVDGGLQQRYITVQRQELLG